MSEEFDLLPKLCPIMTGPTPESASAAALHHGVSRRPPHRPASPAAHSDPTSGFLAAGAAVSGNRTLHLLLAGKATARKPRPFATGPTSNTIGGKPPGRHP